jgi:hypothetical protein
MSVTISSKLSAVLPTMSISALDSGYLFELNGKSVENPDIYYLFKATCSNIDELQTLILEATSMPKCSTP